MRGSGVQIPPVALEQNLSLCLFGANHKAVVCKTGLISFAPEGMNIPVFFDGEFNLE